MVNKCVVYGCKSGYVSEKSENPVSTFRFPLDKPDLLQKWQQFVNRSNWSATKNSVICIKHFEEKFLLRGDKRTKLNWKLSPIPSIHTDEALKRPSTLQNPSVPRKAPKLRVFQRDELALFNKTDLIISFDDLDENRSPPGYTYHKSNDVVLYYRIVFQTNGFPIVEEAIKVDVNLKVQLQFKGIPVPLPTWFVHGRNAKLDRFSLLNNFPNYLQSFREKQEDFNILHELNHRQFFQPKGSPPFSSSMVRFALLLRYTSAAAYKIIKQHLPLPSTSLLEKLRSCKVDSVKAAKLLKEQNKISTDVIIMVDEMYLQKCAQFSGGEYVGADLEGNLYNGIVVFMIKGLKTSLSIVVKACPENKLNGQWLAEEMAQCISQLSKEGFRVRAIITDNHSSNVAAFKTLFASFNSPSQFQFKHPDSTCVTYLFFDTVHLLKNIRNNLLNSKKFVFPAFDFSINDIQCSSQNGYITWRNIHDIYDQDCALKANLRKAPKLTYQSLHPGNKKQNVTLALSVFDSTTIAACKSYFPDRDDVTAFLTLINHWWLICNSKHRFCSNPLSNAVVPNDGKISFLDAMATWIEDWSSSTCTFCLSKQTADALVRTLRSQALLITALLQERYEFVLTARFQTDPLERRFSRYRQMNGGNFLVSLREVLSSEKTLLWSSLLKEDITCWDEAQTSQSLDEESFENLKRALEPLATEISEASLCDDSEEVAVYIAGYICKQLNSKTECEDCMMMRASETNTSTEASSQYSLLMSRGGLTIPPNEIKHYVCNGFAILELVEDTLLSKFSNIPVRSAARYVLLHFGSNIVFACQEHLDFTANMVSKIIVNVYFNNKQNLANDTVRKEQLAEFKKRQRSKRY